MAKVMEFYIPDSFPKKANCTARNQRGKVIEFPSQTDQRRYTNVLANRKKARLQVHMDQE